jgi:hypothetical protein
MARYGPQVETSGRNMARYCPYVEHQVETRSIIKGRND